MFSTSSRRYTISREVDDREEDKFVFESFARYNPHAKAPELSPSNPTFPKYSRALPTRFKLPRINSFNINTKCRRGKSKFKRDKKSKKDKFTASKAQYWKSDENFDSSDSLDEDYQTYPIKSSSSHRSSSVPSNDNPKYSTTDNHENNQKNSNKYYKTLFIKDIITQDIKSDVKKEIKKIKSKNQEGTIIFTLKGTDKKPILDIIKDEIEQVCNHNGYSIKAMNSGTIIECQKKSHDDQFDSSSNVHRTTLLVPCSTEENSLAAIKKRILSLYNGIVTFKPIRKRYNTTLPMEFLNKIVELCKENGYFAKITDIQNQIVECDMRTRIQNNKSALSASSTSTTNQISSSSQSTKLREIDNESANKGYIKVDVPWNSPSKAESVIRSYLSDSSFKGKIRFAPSVGLYSVINMGNFPDRIVDICLNDFHFQAVKFSNQVVECNKSIKNYNANSNSPTKSGLSTSMSVSNLSTISGTSNASSTLNYSSKGLSTSSSFGNLSTIAANRNSSATTKTIQLPINDKKLCEQTVRIYLESGRPGNVDFGCGNIRESSDICSAIGDICKEYNFRFKVIKGQAENQTFSVLNNQFIVECNVIPRNCSQLYIKLSSDNTAMKAKIQRYFESGFIGKIDFSPILSNHATFLFFAQTVSSMSNSYGFTSQIIESQETVRCILSPQYFDLSNYLDDSQIEQAVKNVLTSGIKDSYIVFSVKRKTIPENQRCAEKIVKYCKMLGFQAKLSDFYYQRICVNYMGTRNKPKQSQNTYSSSSISTSSSITSMNKLNAISSNVFVSSSHHVNSNSNSDVLKVRLPSFDPKSAEIMIRKQLSSTFIGVVQFSPKGTLFSSSIMPDYPQRIIDICTEYGFKATVINPRLQIVECRMKQFKYL